MDPVVSNENTKSIAEPAEMGGGGAPLFSDDDILVAATRQYSDAYNYHKRMD